MQHVAEAKVGKNKLFGGIGKKYAQLNVTGVSVYLN